MHPKTLLPNGLLLALVLSLVPLVPAHAPLGTPDPLCEDANGRATHDYGPALQPIFRFPDVEGGFVRSIPIDGHIPAIQFCPGAAPTDPPGDGHKEYAVGGAYLLSHTGLGVPSADPGVPAGSLFCYDEDGHHANPPHVTVEDAVLQMGASFAIGVDTVDLTGEGQGCGDGLVDEWLFCATNPCIFHTGPGLDGAFHVFVEGAGGHVTTD